MTKNTRSSGFTLIEIAIVLVIIGLITGGILTGHHLIEAAKIQRTTIQMERLVAAIYTFKGKYNGLPGDMIAKTAQDYGLTGAPCFDAGGNMTGNPPGGGSPPLPDGCEPFWWPTTGNGLIDEGTRESAGFYTHLSLAHLIEGYLGYSMWALTQDETRVYQEPALKRGIIYPADCKDTSINEGSCFILGASFIWNASGSQTVPSTDLFTSYESYAIDVKIDNGKPNTGRVKVITHYDITPRDVNGNVTGPVPYPMSQTCCKDSSGTIDPQCTGNSSLNFDDEKYRCMIKWIW